MPTSRSNSKCIGITLGDPAGIGPEVVAKALLSPTVRRCGPFKIIGHQATFQKYCRIRLKNCSFVETDSVKFSAWPPGKPDLNGARSSLNALHTAVNLLRAGEIMSLVTGPVSKEGIHRIDPEFQGHTEYFADAFKAKNVGMMFVAGRLKTMIVTRHVPLNRVSRLINATAVFSNIRLTHDCLRSIFKIRRPRIAVCGLNPHAGEGGTIGDEESSKIIPAIKKSHRLHMNVQGPFAADTIFSPVNADKFDAIIAMYHDQGLAPVKALHFFKLVNLTIGLPFIRTSPAHGTAFNIAGKNLADPSSMCEAIKLAARLRDKV